MSNLGPVLEKWGLDMQSGNLFETHTIVLPGVGRKRRRRTLQGPCWGKSKAIYGAFCSAHCCKGRCRNCGEVLEKDDRGCCTECKHDQQREWVEVPALGCGIDGEIEYVESYDYKDVQKGKPIRWPRCRTWPGKNQCRLHPCRHICQRNCDHECTSLECRFVRMQPGVEVEPFGHGDCTCPREWIEAFDFSKQFHSDDE